MGGTGGPLSFRPASSPKLIYITSAYEVMLVFLRAFLLYIWIVLANNALAHLATLADDGHATLDGLAETTALQVEVLGRLAVLGDTCRLDAYDVGSLDPDNIGSVLHVTAVIDALEAETIILLLVEVVEERLRVVVGEEIVAIRETVGHLLHILLQALIDDRGERVDGILVVEIPTVVELVAVERLVLHSLRDEVELHQA